MNRMNYEALRKSDPAPWRVPVAAEDIAETGQHFDLVADENVRSGVARLAGLRDLPRLEASFDVKPHGAGGLHVLGRVSAMLGQNCVVTLEPLSNEVEEEIDLLFMPPSTPARESPAAETRERPHDVKWDEPEPLIGGGVDLGMLATEFLVLGLDPYPRKPGVIFEPPREIKSEESPFAALATWTKGRHGR
jgi:Large ribosomal RNA subunit accumulation protein YceD